MNKSIYRKCNELEFNIECFGMLFFIKYHTVDTAKGVTKQNHVSRANSSRSTVDTFIIICIN